MLLTLSNKCYSVLTYKHELGMNYNFIRPDLIVGSCPQVSFFFSIVYTWSNYVKSYLVLWLLLFFFSQIASLLTMLRSCAELEWKLYFAYSKIQTLSILINLFN